MEAHTIPQASLLLVGLLLGVWGCTPEEPESVEESVNRIYRCHETQALTADQVREALIGRWTLTSASGGGTVCRLEPGTSILAFGADGRLTFAASATNSTEHTWRLAATPTNSGETTLFQIEPEPAIQALRGYVYLCGDRLAIDLQQPYYCQFAFAKE